MRISDWSSDVCSSDLGALPLPYPTMVPQLIFQGAIGAVACAAALSAAMLPLRTEAGETRPVVVELFTSPGCSTCPPADALITELADKPGVLALSFHVDSWAYTGWEVPFDPPAYNN